MARWACSKIRGSRPGPARLRKRWPTPKRSRSSAAATALQRSHSSRSTTGATTARPARGGATARPAAGRRWNCSSTATFPGSKRCAGRRMRRPLISANWKMNLNHFEAIQTVQKLAYLVTKDDLEHVDVSIHPPFTDIRSVQTVIDMDKLQFAVGAQHCHWEDKGAFTGEVSPLFLAKLNVQYVIVGHSERRQLFGETDADVARKIVAVQRHAMTPIVCVGETLEQREANETEQRVLTQIRAALDGLPSANVGALVIAYEPIWAIGTGRTATSAAAQQVCASIRDCIGQIAGPAAANDVRIQYGGSVKASNIAELIAQSDIDGALVGGASLDPDEFARICKLGAV